MHKGLPVKSNLHRQIPTISDTCLRSQDHQELVVHCVVSCHQSSKIGNLLSCHFVNRNHDFVHLADWWSYCYTTLQSYVDGKKKLNMIAVACWNIWEARNIKVFEGKESRHQDIACNIPNLEDRPG